MYYIIPTAYGLQRIAQAQVSNLPLAITQMAVGDGNGIPTNPTEWQSALVHECYRVTFNGSENRIFSDPSTAGKFTAEMMVPKANGGFSVREIGLFDDLGGLCYVGNAAGIYAVGPGDFGLYGDLLVRTSVINSSGSGISIVNDPSAVLATRFWVGDFCYSKSEVDQLLVAVANALPAAIAQGVDEKMVGAIADFDLPAPPPGWLELNGNAVQVSAFSRLDSVMYCGDANNATAEFWYHCSDPENPSGSRSPAGSYLVLRDARGLFRRSWDHGRGMDAGRVFGSYQSDANKEHSHSVDDPGHNHPTNKVNVLHVSSDDIQIYVEHLNDSNNTIQKYAEENTTGVSINLSGEPDGHPKNWAVLTCIKY